MDMNGIEALLSPLPLESGRYGRSWLCRELTYYKIGTGDRVCVFVCDLRANASLPCEAVVRWTEGVCTAKENGGFLSDYNVGILLKKCTLIIIPSTNPDGRRLFLDGIHKQNPFYPRVMKINRSSEDFSGWSANIRGVDLHLNFNSSWLEGKMLERKRNIFTPSPSGYGGEFPESELETSSLCAFLRELKPKAVYYVCEGNSGFYYPVRESGFSEAKRKADFFSGLFSLPSAGEKNQGGSFCGWVEAELGIPALSVDIGNSIDLSEQKRIFTVCAAV